MELAIIMFLCLKKPFAMARFIYINFQCSYYKIKRFFFISDYAHLQNTKVYFGSFLSL